MMNEFDRLWLDIADGSASDKQKKEFNQLLRDDPRLRSQVAQRLLDDAALVEELRTQGLVDSMGNSSIFPQTAPSPSHPTSNNWAALIAPMSLLAVVLMAGFAWWHSPPDRHSNTRSVSQSVENSEGPPATPTSPGQKWPAIVGTVTQSKSARWIPALRNDQHVVARRYKLVAGIARIVLVNGVELIADASDQPVDFQIAEASRQATLHTGMLVAHVHSEQIGFVIHTPTTTIVDVGTQFAVAVDDSGNSQIDVLEGAVACSPNDGATSPNQSIFVSNFATRFTSDQDADGQLVDSKANALRRMQQAIRDNDAEDHNLIAFEPFSESGEPTAGAFGWNGPWCFGRSGNNPARLIVAQGSLPGVPAWIRRTTQAYLVQPIYSIKNRKLSQPIDLAVDRDYFLSAMLRRRVIERIEGRKATVGVSLYSSQTGLKKHGLGFSLDDDDRFTAWTGDDRYNGGRKVDPEEYHFVVLKLAAKKTEPDRLFVRVYQPKDAAEVTEPERWHVIGIPTHSDHTVDSVALWTEQAAVAFFDEIRVGTTWRSVIPIR